ncbi:Major facilitator superfamily MFS_1 (fragment) [Agrobacterium tumefaciens str. B6]|uniref:Major facilitator superfamily MFS_1 n=1 Tax=Agrobacterium tumefaciens str. B6 TaxID=1183423 RepID=A0A822VC65_AGRTU
MLFVLSCAAFGYWPTHHKGIYLAVALWGVAFGGAATILQTAMARTAGEYNDIGQSLLVTAWNLAIAGGGILGGMMLSHWGADGFVPALLVLVLASLVTVVASRKEGFRE